jgi:SSS family solute:Na+ symporter
MFGGFILLIVFAFQKIGTPLDAFSLLPKEHLSVTGGKSVSYIIVWFFIALWTFIDPGFYQRCAAAKTPNTARTGILISVIFWLIFDALTLTSGLYARIAVSSDHSIFAFPALGELLLPPLFYGLFLTGILATIMSTIDSLGFISAFTFGRDIVGKFRIVKSQSNSIQLTRIGLVVTASIAVILAYFFPSVVNLWYLLGSIFVPGLLLPFLLTFTPINLNNMQGIILLIVPVITSLIWFVIATLNIEYSIFNTEPFYPGVVISIIISLIFIYINQKSISTV